MTSRSIVFPKGAFAVAAAFLAALILVVAPPRAIAQKAAATQPEAKATPAEPGAGAKKPQMIEKRISELHKQLKITADEEPEWNALAQVMRDNASGMKALYDKWMSQSGTINALENLKLHSEMADEHAQALHKLVTAFEALYNKMPEDQKKNADAVFAYRIAKAKEMRGKMRHKMKEMKEMKDDGMKSE